MDRWTGEDLGPRQPAGNVARLGIGGFVKSNTGYGSSVSELASKIEVVASKREQKRITEAHHQAPQSPARPVAPAWAGSPPPLTSLQVIKDGAELPKIPVTLAATLFGRGANADVVCDHASLSRLHAQLCFKPATRQWLVVDLGSTHGTFVDEQRVIKGNPAELRPTSILRFGASTRLYRLQTAAAEQTGTHKRPYSEVEDRSLPAGQQSKSRVRFAGSADDSGELAKVIGYSDGKSFAVNVGPSASDGSLKGQFGDLVTPRTVEASIAGKNADQVDGITMTKVQRDTKLEARRPVRRAQPLLPATSSGGLYDMLPTPTSEAAGAKRN